MRTIPLRRLNVDYDIAVIINPPADAHDLEMHTNLQGGAPVLFMKWRFIDIPEILNSVPSYDPRSRTLQPYIVCEAYRESPYWDPTTQTDDDYLKCIEFIKEYRIINETSLFYVTNKNILKYLDAFANR
jgi:hypothetical protein